MIDPYLFLFSIDTQNSFHKSGGEPFTCLMKCLFHARKFQNYPILRNFSMVFHSCFCYPSFNHLCLNLLVFFCVLMSRWYWFLPEVSSSFSLPYVVPLQKKLIFVIVFWWKLFVCINLESITLSSCQIEWRI